MRRRRFQKPRLRNKGGYWIAQFRDLEGRKHKVSLGPVSKTKKYDAERELAQILEPINVKSIKESPACGFGQFVRQIYLPFYQRKWKRSTTEANVERVNHHLVTLFGDRDLKSFARDELQTCLDNKTAMGLSYSVVAHLRWDMRQIFRMAVAEGYLERNPAELLFVPREAPRPQVSARM